MMRRRNDEQLEGYLYQKIENSSAFTDQPIKFRYKIYEAKTDTYTNISGSHYTSRGVTIYTSAPIDFKPGDRVVLDSTSYLVNYVSHDRATIGRLNAARFKSEYLDRLAPKVVSLV